MKKKNLKKGIILSILFFLPVVFLLFLYPSTNNYNPLDVVHEDVLDFSNLSSANTDVLLKNHITVLGFLGDNPESKIVESSNLKELIYDKFQGFKKFQIVMIVAEGTEDKTERLSKELSKFEPLDYWHFVRLNNSDIKKMFNSLRTSQILDKNQSIGNVFVIDKDLNQRGRFDDRTKREIKRKEKPYILTSYNATLVSELKNKLAAEDLRVLFTEYRQKRKGEFNSTVRRAEDLKGEQHE